MVKDQAQFRDGDTFKIYGMPVKVREGHYLFGDGSGAPVTDPSLQRYIRVGAISEYKHKITFRHGDRFVGKDLSSYDEHGDVCMGYPLNERDGCQHSYVPADPNKTYDEFGRPSPAKDQAMHRRAQRAESRALRAEKKLNRIHEVLEGFRSEMYGVSTVGRAVKIADAYDKYLAQELLEDLEREDLIDILKHATRRDRQLAKEIIDA
jgi:hypothetical protein